ncbi:MAG: putative Fe-S cluster assembly protein SufT [Planctomycetota bacterium]|nr:putative Fe-S cluster assembly protein SufT [Planctomycetota bacterium]
MAREAIELTRDCPVVLIPSGFSTGLPKGTKVTLMQSLGGTHTVLTEHGQMVRIGTSDADALGLEVEAAPDAGAAPPANASELKERVFERLRTVYDPEVPVNVVELGLVYDCKIEALDGGYDVKIDMTLTAPGCGMGDVLRRDALQRVQELPGVKQADVRIVLDPPWEKGMMSEAARLQLGMF